MTLSFQNCCGRNFSSIKLASLARDRSVYVYTSKFIKIFVLFFLFLNLFKPLLSQTPNLDSLSNTFTDVEDINKDYYTELDSFKMDIELYAKNQKPDKKLIDAKQLWAKLYAIKDPIKSMVEFEGSIGIAEKLGHEKGVAVGKHEIGLLYFKEGLYNHAIDNYNQSSSIFEHLNEWWLYGFSLIDIGNVYFKLQQFEISREYYKMAYEVFISHKFKEKYEFAVSVCYNNLGLADMEEKKYNQALDNFVKALHWRQVIQLEEYYGHSYKYIAYCFLTMEKADSAQKYYELAVEYDLKKGPKTELIKSYIGLGKLYKDIKQFKFAQVQFDKAYYIANIYGLGPMLILSANEMAQFYIDIQVPDSSIKYFKIALDNSKIYGEIDGRQLASEKLLEIAKSKNDMVQEILYLNELLKLEKQKQIDVVLKKQLEYEVNKRISDKTILESSNRIQQIIILSVLIILTLLTFVLYYIYRSRRKYILLNNHLENKNIEFISQAKKLEQVNRALNEYSNKVFHQKEEIMSQAESLSNAINELRELQKFKEGMAAMIVHDLKNPLNTILNQTKNVLVYDSANQMLTMVNNILDLQKYESIDMPTNKKKIILNTVIETSIFNTRYLSEQKNINIKNQTSRKYEVFADPELTERIITNLLTNAIKYSPLSSSIKIISEPQGFDFIKINVIDNGPGISGNAKNHIFEKFTQLITQNSGLTRSSGLGLAFCKMAVEAHGGKIEVEPNDGGGAVFWFTIPLSKTMDIIDKPLDQFSDSDFHLTSEAYQSLMPYLEELKKIKVYEIADIQRIIANIENLGILKIDSWLKAIENSSYSVNEEEYKKLLLKIKDGSGL
jgi:signal transduction histidine kinase